MTTFGDTVREIRAGIVHEELCARPELVERVEDILRMPRFALWGPLSVREAVDDLIAQGLISEADGRLRVRPRSAA